GSLAAHPWPGNLRELRNHLERCAILQRQMTPEEAGPADANQAPRGEEVLDLSRALPEAREIWNSEFERRYVQEILIRHQGNVSEAARASGVDRRYFHRLLQRHRLR